MVVRDLLTRQFGDVLDPVGVALVLKSSPSVGEKAWLERLQPPPLVSPLQPTSAEQLLGMLTRGNRNRTQHPTDANATSSRSHAIFQVRRATGQDLSLDSRWPAPPHPGHLPPDLREAAGPDPRPDPGPSRGQDEPH